MSRAVQLGRWSVSTSIIVGLLFLCAGTTAVPMLRAYLAIFAGAGLATAVLTDAAQDDERRKPGPEETHPNSRRAATVLFLITVVVAAFDAGRFHWVQPVSLTIQALAFVVVIFAAGLQVWAMAANAFFSTAIRIQTERGHQLVTRGPYCYIRHPGYVAMVIIMPATAIALGSITALVPAVCYSALILWRTKREDEFLMERLADYAGYAGRVGFRLIPGLW